MSYDFTTERLIDAEPDVVWEAMLDPDAQREWWTDGRPVKTGADLRVGGKAYIEWETEHGHVCRAEQVFVVMEKPHRLVFRETVYEPNSPVYECTLTFTFEARDRKTFLTLHHEGFPTQEDMDPHRSGTEIFLDRLTRYVSRASV